MAEERILLIDDDEDDHLITRGLFAEMERGLYRLEGETTFDGGLAAIRACEHSAYLIDFHLGAHTGLELLREARAIGCRAPMIVLTGQGDRSLDLEVMQAGAADFLDKGQLTSALLERSVRYAIERRRSEERLERTDAERARLAEVEQRLQEAVRVRDEFLSIASHELKTPLTPLSLQLDALRRVLVRNDIQDPAVTQLLETSRRHIRRLRDLIENLLDVARITGGRLTLQRERVLVSELLLDLAERFRPQAEAAHSTIRVECDSELEATWDPFRVEQVISNLLANALKYGAGKPVDLEASVVDGLVQLSVRDRGIGIAPEDAQRIFGRFERAASVRQYGGLGLGLYIANQIVEAHGGQMAVQSQPGQGARVSALLPLEPPARDLRPHSAMNL